jgi:dihydroorotate dehydrogenase electron transfer subunit
LNQAEATVISNTGFFPGSTSPMKRVTGTHLMWLECPQIAAEARPGQFIMIRCDDLTLPRPISIHQVRNGNIALLFAVLEGGQGTNWLARRRPAEQLQVFGPLGNGFAIDAKAKQLLLVAGGIGIAPLCYAAQDAISRGLRVTLLMGAQTAKQVYPRHLLPAGIEIFTATDDGSDGEKSMVTGLIAKHVSQTDQVFTCGPLAMYRFMANNKKSLGLAELPVQVSLEITMACGHGVCYGCSIKTKQGLKQVCQDGPVFDMGEVVWSELVG